MAFDGSSGQELPIFSPSQKPCSRGPEVDEGLQPKTAQWKSAFDDWPFSLPSYVPDIIFGEDVKFTLKEFEQGYLSDTTDIQVVDDGNGHPVQRKLDQNQLLGQIEDLGFDGFKCYFINRSKDNKRLSISPSAFRALIARYEVPPSFIASLRKRDLPSAQGIQSHMSTRRSLIWSLWDHALSRAGSNQMDPSNYLHLNDSTFDIRGSHIAVFFRHDSGLHHVKTIVVSFQDGRWREFIDEPQRRMLEVLQQRGNLLCHYHPYFPNLVIITSAIRWWTDALVEFNGQLIACEALLQDQIGRPANMSRNSSKRINKDIHTMAAHLHRYRTETETLENVVSHIWKAYLTVRSAKSTKTHSLDGEHDTFQCSMMLISSQIKGLKGFVEELLSKTQTLLNLLFNNVQMTNDEIQVINGESMRKMMEAAKEEAFQSRLIAKQSQKMARDMRKDSVSMKTIAVLTMFFLPGTSYAAILSMPFFAELPWMTTVARVWVWIALTLPSTGLSFLIYMWWKKHEVERSRKEYDDNTGDFGLEDLSPANQT